MLMWGRPTKEVSLQYLLDNQDKVDCLQYKYSRYVIGFMD